MFLNNVVFDTPSVKSVLDYCSAADCRSFIGLCQRDWLRSCFGFRKRTDLHSLLFLPFFFPFNLLFICVMWSRLILRRSVSNHWCSSLVCCENLFFSFSYCFHVFLLNSLCDFLEWSTYFPIICCIDTFFIDLNAASDQIFSLFINFLWNSLMSSSHLFVDLPFDLWLLYF